jgi:putative colanic acid biosynthesis glycosyltransferase WcaI
MTRVLITSLNYAPEATGIGVYSTMLAEHLAARGYRVTVLTGMPHYPAWRVAPDYAGRTSMTELRNGVEVRRRSHYVPSRQSALTRGLYEVTSLRMAVDAVRLPRPDAVLGVVPSLSGGIAARAAAARFRVPYGLIFQDLVGAAAEQSGVAGGGRVTGVVRAAEGWAARGAAAVGVVADGFRPHLESLGVDAARIRHLRNWTHAGEATIARTTMRASLGWADDTLVCLHAGNMGYKQGLENVLEAARLAQQWCSPVLFVLMGDGNQRPELERVAATYKLTNLRFLPLQPEDRFASVLAAADILLVNQRGSVKDMSLPSKLTSYFASGRPVVAAAAPHSETAREVSFSSGGLVVTPDDPPELLGALLRVASDAGLRAHMAESARAWTREMLSAGAALRGYEQLLASVLASGRHGRVHTPGRRFGVQREADVTAAAADRNDRWAA